MHVCTHVIMSSWDAICPFKSLGKMIESCNSWSLIWADRKTIKKPVVFSGGSTMTLYMLYGMALAQCCCTHVEIQENVR